MDSGSPPGQDRTIACPKPKNPWAAHARRTSAMRRAIQTRPHLPGVLAHHLSRDGSLHSHLSWHLALGHLEAGDAARLTGFLGKLSHQMCTAGRRAEGDRSGLLFCGAGTRWASPRCEAWRLMHDFATARSAGRRGLFDIHIALTQAVAGKDAALDGAHTADGRAARSGPFPSGPVVSAVSRLRRFRTAEFSRRQSSA